MSIKVSVIIPVYNAEKYITQCIESLLGQTLPECEFIFINDGSKDNSAAIIKEYKKRDNRMKLVNQSNQGVSAARNTGLRIAAGEFIGFVDADDFVEKEMFETLFIIAKKHNCDIVVSNFESYMNGHRFTMNLPYKKNTNLSRLYIQEKILPNFLRSDNLNAIWNKIYRNNLIKANNIKFPEGISLGEDALFNIKYFSHSSNVHFISYSGYHYKEVEGSATRNFLEKDYFKRVIEEYNTEIPEINKVIEDKDFIKRLKAIKLINNVMSIVHIYLTPIKGESKRKQYILVKRMISNKYVREALHICRIELESTLGRYEKLIIKLIERKSTLGLYCITAYSRFRNK